MPAILFAGVLVFFLGFELFGLPLCARRPTGRAGTLDLPLQLTNKLGVPSYQLMAVVSSRSFALTARSSICNAFSLRQAQRYVSVREGAQGRARSSLAAGAGPHSSAIMVWFCATVVIPLAGITVRSFVVLGARASTSRRAHPRSYREILAYPNVVRV